MSYDTYRPDWDPFFSESWVPRTGTPRIDWGDRSADPKSDRVVKVSSPAEVKEEKKPAEFLLTPLREKIFSPDGADHVEVTKVGE
jgi:hypothetical protein